MPDKSNDQTDKFYALSLPEKLSWLQQQRRWLVKKQEELEAQRRWLIERQVELEQARQLFQAQQHERRR